MKATAWEKEDVLREGVAILNDLVPKEFVHHKGQLTGVRFEAVKTVYENGKRTLVPTGVPLELVPCDDVIIAAGQETAFPWVERDLGIEFDERGLPKLDAKSFQSTRPSVFFGGDAAFGPKNIITAVAQGHEAAISIDLFLSGQSVDNRPAPTVTMTTRKMPAVVEHNPEVSADGRFIVPLRSQAAALSSIKAEVELGFDLEQAIAEAGRCLNCDLETVFTPKICVECKACENVCPTDCITFTKNSEEDDLRKHLKAPAQNLTQDLYIAGGLVSGRVMVKNEDVCLHCGLCAQNCPTGAWQMQPFLFEIPLAGEAHMTAALGATKHG
jgi:ferredoxin